MNNDNMCSIVFASLREEKRKVFHAYLGDNSGGTAHLNHVSFPTYVLSQRMQHPGVCTVPTYVPSRLMYRPDFCTVLTYVGCLAVTGRKLNVVVQVRHFFAFLRLVKSPCIRTLQPMKTIQDLFTGGNF